MQNFIFKNDLFLSQKIECKIKLKLQKILMHDCEKQNAFIDRMSEYEGAKSERFFKIFIVINVIKLFFLVNYVVYVFEKTLAAQIFPRVHTFHIFFIKIYFSLSLF